MLFTGALVESEDWKIRLSWRILFDGWQQEAGSPCLKVVFQSSILNGKGDRARIPCSVQPPCRFQAKPGLLERAASNETLTLNALDLECAVRNASGNGRQGTDFKVRRIYSPVCLRVKW